MSKTTFEKLGIPYEERDGIFYPVLVAGTEKADIEAGKYGRMWIKYIKEEYPIRNTSVHDLCEVDSHEKEYRKLQKYNFKTEAKFSKLVAPNKYEEISFDDFVMFSRSCVELAIYIFEKMAYDYTKIALDIPDKQISKWRKYSKNRQEKALCSYIKTLYKVDEEFIEQIPKLLNMIIDPIV